MLKEFGQILGSFDKKEKIGTLIFIITLVLTQIATGSTLVAFIAGMLGVLYVILVKKGSRLCYIFGALQIMLYIYISLTSRFYGDVMLNTFNLIMQPIGFYMWSKSSNKGVVKSNALTMTGLVLIFSTWFSVIILYWLPLRTLGGNTPFIDSITTVSSMLAMILSVFAFRDQWIFWLICNFTSIVMWTLALLRGDNSATPMVIMWIAYFINSVDAFKQWYKR